MAATETAGWLGANLSFWAITILVLVSAAFTVYARSIIQAAYSLFFTLLGMAGFYVLLGSGFLAIAQVIIYIGGILVLIMFGVLLTDRPIAAQTSSLKWTYAAASLGTGLLLVNVFIRIILSADWQPASALGEPREAIAELGHVLLGSQLLSLELAGLTLLLCLIGAAYLVRRREQ
ncbi:MAG TPA: NADH-quinone oxidoreductase subunit J [Oligoflexia bacterium]|nr:NADH-quinone oxidoreductase subunit J [Oligoflexia bacterium]